MILFVLLKLRLEIELNVHYLTPDHCKLIFHTIIAKQLDALLTKQLFPFTCENILEKDERKIKQGSRSMGRSKETFAAGTSRCLLFHPFPLHAPEQPNHRTVSSNATDEKAVSCSTPSLCLWDGTCMWEEEKEFWEEIVIKQPKISEMAMLGTLALRCCFSEQSCFQ